MPNVSTTEERKDELAMRLSFYESEFPRLRELYGNAATPTERRGWFETLCEWQQRMSELQKEIAQLDA